MDTREARIEAVSKIVYRWTPPAELQIAGPEGGSRVRKIAEEVITAIQHVEEGEVVPPSQELLELRETVGALYSERDALQQELTRSNDGRTDLHNENTALAAKLQASDQTVQRLQAANEMQAQRYQEDVLRRSVSAKELSDRIEVAENDREFYRMRAAALQASLDRLLSRAEMITQRKPIDDWGETLNEARHVLNNGAATL